MTSSTIYLIYHSTDYDKQGLAAYKSLQGLAVPQPEVKQIFRILKPVGHISDIYIMYHAIYNMSDRVVSSITWTRIL